MSDDTLVVRYVGFRPFRIDAGDAPLRHGDVVDADHAYARHRLALMDRVDFERIDLDTSEEISDG